MASLGWRRSPVRRASETGDLNDPGVFIAISGFYYYYYDASGWGLTGGAGVPMMRGFFLFPFFSSFLFSFSFLFASHCGSGGRRGEGRELRLMLLLVILEKVPYIKPPAGILLHKEELI